MTSGQDALHSPITAFDHLSDAQLLKWYQDYNKTVTERYEAYVTAVKKARNR